MKNVRFPLKKVFFWVLLVNVILFGITLLVLFYVKVPNRSPNPYIKEFNIPRHALRTGYAIVFYTVYFYFALNGYYKLIRQQRKTEAYILWSLLVLLFSFVYYWLYDMAVKNEEFNQAFDISVKIFSYSFVCLFQLGIAGIIVAITRQLDEKNQQIERSRILEQQKTQLEKEKMQANYLFLKAQINPHFLHNTLNFLYAKSLPYSTELSEGILTLSEIMRYSLNKEEDAEGKVLLTQEIEHVNNIIRIQQLRFGNTLQVHFDRRGELEGLRILPFILITIVENAFKHGELKNVDHPISLELAIDGSEVSGAEAHRGKQLHFHCINKKKTGPKELSTGIGLDNTRKRLELAYGENYALYIKNQKELFVVDLTLLL